MTLQPGSALPADPPIPRWVELLVSVYYRTSWQRAGLKEPEALQLDAERRWQADLPPLDEALDELEDRARARSTQLDVLVGRLALAQLARARSDLPALTPAELIRMAGLARALLSHDSHSANKWTSSKTNGLLQELLASSSDGDARFAYAYAHRAFAFLDRFSLQEIWTARSFGSRVSDATTSVLVRRPLADFGSLITPLSWLQLPFLWNQAFFTDRVPTELGQDPPPVQPASLFFENIKIGWNAFPITRYRNVLAVKLASTADSLSFEYSERTCMTTEILGGPRQPGGLDVDEGSASAIKVTVTGQDWIRFTGRKRFRGSLPAPPFDEDFAQIISVLNPLLIEALILLGSQF